MSREIAKAKPTSTTNPASTSSSSSNTKYLKRAELERQRETAYLAEQEKLQRQRDEQARKKRKFDEDEAERAREREEKKARLAEESRRRRVQEAEREERARRKRLGLPDPPPKDLSEEDRLPDGVEDISDDELIVMLREEKQPARLFGENHRQRLRRYRKLRQKPMVGFTTLELVPEKDMKVDQVPPIADAEGRAWLFRQLASYFSMVLHEWEAALERRPASVRESFQGKAAYNAMVQARENMKPLFRKFEKGELDVLESVVEIVKAAQEKRYVDANDGYLRLSIGKAYVSVLVPLPCRSRSARLSYRLDFTIYRAWPIGVTMVGIHERSAREKLHESEAHIMSDEVTRKFLQSIKRCLSFAQTRWPPEDQLQLMG